MATFVPYKTYFYNQFHGMASLIVTSIGKEQSPPGFVHGPEIRTSYSLHFCLKGGGTVRINNRVYPVKAGQLMLVYPNMKVYPKADHQNPWELCWVGFTGADARLLTEAIGFSPFHPVVDMPCNSHNQIEALFMDVYANRGDRPAQIVGMTAKLYSCLSFLMAQTMHAFPHTPGCEYVHPACDYISLHYQEKLTIDDIAAVVGVSRSCLFRAFKANMAMSPLDYLTEHRVKASCNLLEQGNLSIKEIAYQCGFSSPLYYSKVFKKVMGICPKQYMDHISN